MVYNFNIFNDKKKISRDKYNYILSYLHVGSYRPNTKDKWVNLNSDLLSDVFKDGPKYLKELIEEGYIECDGIYKKGIKSFSYRINYNKVPKKGMKVYDNKYYNKTIKMIESGHHKLDYKTKFIIDETRRLFNENIIKFDNIEGVKRILNRYKKENYDRFYSQSILVDKIISGNITTTTDKQGARIYTNYSNLSREIRKHLTINNERKICIDISNSQWQTLCLTIMERKPNINKNFMKITHNGKLYEYFMSKTNYDRDKVKKDMLNWLYAELHVCSNKKEIQYVEHIMKNDFPEIYEMIKKIKSGKNGGSNLARNMQLKESTIIKNIQYHLMINDIKVISLHDSLYLPLSTSGEVIEYIIDELIKSGYTSIKVEKDLKEIKEFNIKLKEEIYKEIRKGERKHIHMYPKNKIEETKNIQKRKSDELLITKNINLDNYLENLYKELKLNGK